MTLGGRASTGDSGMVPEGERVRSRAASECGGAISGSAHRARSLGGLTAEGERASSGGRASSELRMLGRSCRRIGAAGGGVAVTGVSGTVDFGFGPPGAKPRRVDGGGRASLVRRSGEFGAADARPKLSTHRSGGGRSGGHRCERHGRFRVRPTGREASAG